MLVAKLKMRKIYTNVFELSVDDIGAGDRMSGEERQKFYFFSTTVLVFHRCISTTSLDQYPLHFMYVYLGHGSLVFFCNYPWCPGHQLGKSCHIDM